MITKVKAVTTTSVAYSDPAKPQLFLRKECEYEASDLGEEMIQELIDLELVICVEHSGEEDSGEEDSGEEDSGEEDFGEEDFGEEDFGEEAKPETKTSRRRGR